MRHALEFVLAGLIGTGIGFAQDEPKSAPRTDEVVARFHDGTTLRRIVLQESVEIQTKYGKLAIPVRDIRRIEFGIYSSPEDVKKVAAAIRNLGAEDFQLREAAGKELIALGARAHAALLEAARSGDQEVARRAQEVLDRLREQVPEELLRRKPEDVIRTADCVLTGRIQAPTLKVRTPLFGDMQLKLADLRSIHTISETQLTVDAARHGSAPDQWLDTGFEVDAETGLTIVAGGRVDLSPQAAGQAVCDADGNPNFGQTNTGIPFGALIGRIGERGEAFYIGKRFQGRPGQAGRLYLQIVSIPGAGGSTGTYKVKLTADPGVAEGPRGIPGQLGGPPRAIGDPPAGVLPPQPPKVIPAPGPATVVPALPNGGGL
jgi:hypothetical protein